MPIARSLQTSLNTVRAKFVAWNLFDSHSTDRTIIFRELLSTRIFLILFTFSIFILTVYTSLSVQVKTETVMRPTQAIYERLQKKHPATLQCFCAEISIPYGTFVDVVPVFHQVCSSRFVSQLWIDFAFATNTTFIWPMDIRTYLSPMWQLISALCQSARNTLIDSFDQFTNSTLIHSTMLSEELLEARTKADLDLTYRTAPSIFMRPFIAIHQITQANWFMTGLIVDSAALQRRSLEVETGYVGRKVSRYTPQGTKKSCFCKSDESCPIPGGLYLYEASEVFGNYDLNQILANETLPGFILDCLPLKMTLASSLECFYNESCLQILLAAYYPKTINISILDNSTTSRFVPTTTVEQLINELFVEEVRNKTNYTSYYRTCAPVYCSYTYSRRFDWIYTATTLLALAGGLSAVLRFITPYGIKFIFYLYRRQSLQIESQPNETTTIAAHVKIILLKIKRFIIEFNLFNVHSQDPLRILYNRIATRLYVLLLIGTISVLITYTSISIETMSKTIQSPSLELYETLQQQYPHTLRCPCSVVSIPYKELIEVTPTYHQLCTSDFVQPRWYESVKPSLSEYAEPHLLYTGSSHFRTLAMFCEIANLSIIAETDRFSSMIFTNGQMMTAELFNSQMNTLIDTLVNSTQAEFLSTLSLITAVLQANQYVSIWESNVVIRRMNFSGIDPFMIEPSRVIAFSTTSGRGSSQTCYCVRNGACNVPSDMDEYLPPIEGMPSASCSILDSVLESTLTCWYNETCFDYVQYIFDFSSIPITKNATLLNPYLSSRFSPDTPVKMIVNEIMVERWDRSVSYRNFYQNCQPAYCSFAYQDNIYIVYIITTVIGLLGGLDDILKLLSPVFVKIFFKIFSRTNPNNASQAPDSQQATDQHYRGCLRQYHIWAKLRNTFKTLNLFESGSTRIEVIRHELLSTRLYLLLFLISICIVIIYTVLPVENMAITVPMPSQAEYEKLMILHSNALQCPCEHMSVKHEQFITVNNSFHQVCSSDFVKDVWLDYLFGDGLWYNYKRSDLRVRGSAYFWLLSTLCIVSKKTIENSVEQFRTKTFVNAEIMPEYEFLSKMSVIRQQFETTTSTRFSRSLRLLRDVTHGNAFISSYFLNWEWWVKPNKSTMTFPTRPIILDNGCSCGTRSDCTESGGIYGSFSDTKQYFSMPGLHVGCSSVETVLHSTLECLYNQTCIDLLVHYATTVNTTYPIAINISAMKPILSSRFSMNTMIENIVDVLFVEQWNINTSYSTFYNQCAPLYCTYTIEKHNSFLNIMLSLLGLYGGLTISLRFIVPYLIKLAFKIKNRFFANAVTPLA